MIGLDLRDKMIFELKQRFTERLVMRKFFMSSASRRAGALAFVIAVALTTAWVKSKFIGDKIQFVTGSHKIDCIVSMDGLLMWTTYREGEDRDPRMVTFVPQWYSLAFFASSDLVDAPTVRWHWRFGRFGSLTNSNIDQTATSIWVIPYWFVTIPLFSAAWFLLSTPLKPAISSAAFNAKE